MKIQVKNLKIKRCYLCKSRDLKLIGTIAERPEKETDFGISRKDYYREIYLCNSCGVYNNFHNYDLSSLYLDRYNEATYAGNMLKAFNRIRGLPEYKSDNKGRVKRIVEFCKKRSFDFPATKVLDVGSGLCVFLAELKNFGFKCYCIDPDSASIKQALRNAKVDGAFLGKFQDFKTDIRFDIVTFNKVLEHIQDPLFSLRRSKKFINERGIIYIELPDGETALKNGEVKKREEFYIDHYTIFTEESLKFLIKEAGFVCLEFGRIHEPSDKYTMYAFFSPKTNNKLQISRHEYPQEVKK